MGWARFDVLGCVFGDNFEVAVVEGGNFVEGGVFAVEKDEVFEVGG